MQITHTIACELFQQNETKLLSRLVPINSFFQKGGTLSRLGALANKYVVTTDWSDPYKEKQMKLRNKLSWPNIFPVYNFLISSKLYCNILYAYTLVWHDCFTSRDGKLASENQADQLMIGNNK